MLRGVSPLRGGSAFACAILLSLGWSAVPTRGAEITWDRVSPFQGCLAAGLNKWLEAQVDTLTNDDPASWRMDDVAVFKWMIGELASCKAKAGSSDQATEMSFTKYMAQWRDHVYQRVEDVRQKGKPD
jgi:hypothetical protein